MRTPAIAAFLLALTAATHAEARTWTSADGQYRIEADLVKIEADAVVLQTTDGRTIQVPLAQLSPADQGFVRRQRAGPGARQAQTVTEFIAAARTALRSRDLARAGEMLDSAQAKANTAEEKTAVAEARQLADTLTKFWNAVAGAGARLRAAIEIDVGQTKVIVVESAGNRLVVRALGRNYAFQLDKPESIPAALAVGLVRRTAGGAVAARYAAALQSVDDGSQDQRLWTAAGVGRPPPSNLTDLVPHGTMPKTPFAPPQQPITQPTPGAKTDPSNPPAERASEAPLPAPPAEKIAAARKQVRAILQEDFNRARAPDEQLALAQKLFDMAVESHPDDPASCIALADEAYELAAEAGGMAGALRIVDFLDRSYKLDDIVDRKALVFGKTVRQARTPDQLHLVVDRCMGLFDRAAVDGRFEALDRLEDAAVAAARMLRNRALALRIQKEARRLKAGRAAFDDIAAAEKTLKENPDDPDANLKVGLFRCRRGEWDSGLPLLVKGTDKQLAEIARRDLAKPTDAKKQLALADGWWDLAETDQQAEHGPFLRARAAFWYHAALPELAGISKLKAQKRLEEAGASGVVGVEPSPAEKVFLADLTPAGVQGVYKQPLVRGFETGGKQFDKAIWAQPDRQQGMTRVAFALGRRYDTFSGTVGMEGKPGTTTSPAFQSPMVFRIFGDDKLLWTSKRLIHGGESQDFKVFVNNVNVLVLVAQCGGHHFWAKGGWGDPALTRQ